MNKWSAGEEFSADDEVARILVDMATDAFDEALEQDDDLTRFSYRLTEPRDAGPVEAVYGFAIAGDTVLQFAVYADRVDLAETGRRIFHSFAHDF